jgi:hypothetical protein
VEHVTREQPEPSKDKTLLEQLRAVNPEQITPEQFAIHRGIDVLVGLLLITNLFRTTGVFIGENGALSITVAGPLITRNILEQLLRGEDSPNPGPPPERRARS